MRNQHKSHQSVSSNFYHTIKAMAVALLLTPVAASYAAMGVQDSVGVAPEATSEQLLFVDSSVADREQLLLGVDPSIEIVLLEPSRNGVTQMSEVLAGRVGIDAIHIVSHGSEGQIILGDTTVNTNHLEQNTRQWADIGQALNANGDLLLYGCKVASGEGTAFVDALADLTGADVAASDDITGAVNLGGNWYLEIAGGSIEAAVFLSDESAADYQHILPTFTFDSATEGLNIGATVTETVSGITLTGTITGTTWGNVDFASYSVNIPGLSGTSLFDNAPDHPGETFSFSSAVDLTSFLLGTQGGRPGDILTFTPTGGINSPVTATLGSTNTSQTVTLNWTGVTSFTVAETNNDGLIYDVVYDNLVFAIANAAPTITGTSTGQTVSDSTTVSPFSAVTIADTDGDNVTATITLDDSTKGLFTAASLSTSGFSTADGGTTYTHLAATPANMATAIRALVYNPADNRVAPGSTETSTFSIAINDGTVTTNSTNTTTVVSTSINDAPTDIGLSSASVNQSGGDNAVVGALSTTDADTDDSFTYTLVAGAGDTNNEVFNINGADLRANNTSILAADSYSVRVESTDSSSATFSKAFTITVVDDVAPTANFGAATDNVGIVTGALSSGDTTDDTALVLSGTNESGSSVNVFNGAGLLGAATVVGTNWSYSATVANGTTYQFNVKESDAAGNTSTATANFTVIGDTAAPIANFSTATDNVGTVTGALASGDTTDDTALVLSGTNESGSSVNVFNGAGLLSTATVVGTNWSYSAAVTNGTTYQFNVTESDATGNTSAATANFTVIGDTAAPTANFGAATDDVGTVTGALNSGDTTNDTALVLSGTNESSSSVNVFSGAGLLGAATVVGTNWSYSAAVTNGTTYQFNVKESDAAGNTSAATANFTVIGDTAAPTANFSAATDNVGTVTGALASGDTTDDTALMLSGTNESGSTVDVFNGAVLLGAANVVGTNWSYSATVANGTTYQFNVKESDAAGNTGAATANFTIIGDTAAPTANFGAATDDAGTVTGTLASGDTTDDTALMLSGTNESGSTVDVFNGAVLLDAANVVGTNWSYSATVADGTTYQFNVKETDATGNASAATSNFTVIGDTTGPGAATGILAIDENTSNGTAVGTATSNGATSYTLTDNAGGRFAIGAGTGAVTVADGTLLDHETNTSHSITVQSTDSAGNTTDTVMIVTINEINEIPTVNLDDNDSSGAGGNDFTTSFSAEGPAVVIADVDAVLGDVDAVAQIASLSITLTNRPDGDAVESLALDATATTAATGAGLTVSYTDTSGLLLISGNAAPATYQTILRGIVYDNTDAVLDITQGNRTINVVANDGSGDSLAATSTVKVVTAPVVDLGGDGGSPDLTGSYSEGDGTTLESSTATITEPDGDNLNQLLIELTNPLDGASEALTLSGGAGVRGAVTVTYTSASLITLTGVDTPANYERLLQELQYSNSSENPTTTARSITVTSRDVGNNSGAVATLTLNITAVNDAPTLTNNTGFTVLEGGTTTLATANLKFSDVDTPPAELTYTVTTLPGAGQLEFAATPGVRITTFSQDDIDTSKVDFIHDGSEGAGDAFIVGMSDGSGGSVTGTIVSVTVTPVDDAPVISGTPATTISHGSAYSFVPTASDTEDDVMSFAIVNKPTWAAFDTVNGALTGVPSSAALGTTGGIVITVTANAKSNSLAAFDITVTNSPPVFTGTPTIIGIPKVGQTLGLLDTGTADPEGATVTLSYQWASNGVDIPGATLETCQLIIDDKQKTVTCTITANDGSTGGATFTTAGVVVKSSFPWLILTPGLVSPNKVSGGGL